MYIKVLNEVSTDLREKIIMIISTTAKSQSISRCLSFKYKQYTWDTKMGEVRADTESMKSP